MGYIKKLRQDDIAHTSLQLDIDDNIKKAYATIASLPDDYVDEKGNTLLHYAGMYHDEYLLEKYADKIDANIFNAAKQDVFTVAINSYFGQIVLQESNTSPDTYHLQFLKKLLAYTNGSLATVRSYYENYSPINKIVLPPQYKNVFELIYNHENKKTTEYHNELLKNTIKNKALISLLPLFDMPHLQFHVLDNDGSTFLHTLFEKLKYVKNDPAPITEPAGINVAYMAMYMMKIKKYYYSYGDKADPLYYKSAFEYVVDKVLHHPNMKQEYMYIKNKDNISPYDMLQDFPEYKARCNYYWLQQDLPYHQGKSQQKNKI